MPPGPTGEVVEPIDAVTVGGIVSISAKEPSDVPLLAAQLPTASHPVTFRETTPLTSMEVKLQPAGQDVEGTVALPGV